MLAALKIKTFVESSVTLVNKHIEIMQKAHKFILTDGRFNYVLFKGVQTSFIATTN